MFAKLRTVGRRAARGLAPQRSPRWRTIGLAIAAVGLFVGLWPAASPLYGQQKFSKGVLIRFEGAITPFREQYLYRKLAEANELGADLVVIEVDSPGGGLIESKEMARRLRNLDWAHTVAFVPEEALSGAAIFSLGCREIIMAPNAVFGDAGPIFLGEDFLFRHAPEKVRSDLARLVRDLAEARGRPPALAEAMVDQNLVVYQVRHRQTGERAYMSKPEIASSDDPEQWEILQPVLESREGHFLEVNGTRAVELGLADGLAADRAELAARYGLQQPFEVLEWNSVDTAVSILNHPLVTGLLLVVGLVALYFELASPGIGIGGLVSLVSFCLFFWSRFFGGTAQWLELVLFLLGLALLVIEVSILPSFGLWGITGLLLCVASLVMASESFFVPQTQDQLSELGQSALVVILSLVVFVVAAIFITARIGKIPFLARLALAPPSEQGGAVPNAVGEMPAATNDSASDALPLRVGDVGVTDSPLRPAGKARFGDLYVDVFSDGRFVDPGVPVRIVEIRGTQVQVRPVQ